MPADRYSQYGNGRAAWPTTIDELESEERFFVLSLRYVVFGRSHGDVPGKRMLSEFLASLGARDGEKALTCLRRLARCLKRHARRTVSLHAPCDPRLGVDEAWAVCFVAACQNRQPHLARALARWMIEPAASDELMEAAIGFARILYKNAVILPLRVGRSAHGRATVRPYAHSATVH